MFVSSEVFLRNLYITYTYNLDIQFGHTYYTAQSSPIEFIFQLYSFIIPLLSTLILSKQNKDNKKKTQQSSNNSNYKAKTEKKNAL